MGNTNIYPARGAIHRMAIVFANHHPVVAKKWTIILERPIGLSMWSFSTQAEFRAKYNELFEQGIINSNRASSDDYYATFVAYQVQYVRDHYLYFIYSGGNMLYCK